MRHPVRLYLDPDDELYHSTPACEAIPTARKLQLRIVEEQAPVEERWGCEKCCPADIYYPARSVLRLPMTFHVDADCAVLIEDRQRGRPVGEMWVAWPEREYDKIVADREAWTPCSQCIKSSDVLNPLGSPKRSSRAA